MNARLADTFGEDVEYVARGASSGVSIRGIWREGDAIPPGFHAVLETQRSAFSQNPAKGETINLAGRSFFIADIGPVDATGIMQLFLRYQGTV